MRHRRHTVLTPEIRQRIVNLKAEGLTYEKIAAQVGVCTTTVCNVILDNRGVARTIRRRTYSAVYGDEAPASVGSLASWNNAFKAFFLGRGMDAEVWR